MADLIERLARAVYPHIVYGTDFSEVPIDEAFSRARYSFLPPLCRNAAIAALEAMQEPSDEMVEAGADAYLAAKEDAPNNKTLSLGHLLRPAYKAMVVAAKIRSGNDGQ